MLVGFPVHSFSENRLCLSTSLIGWPTDSCTAETAAEICTCRSEVTLDSLIDPVCRKTSVIMYYHRHFYVHVLLVMRHIAYLKDHSGIFKPGPSFQISEIRYRND